jgi:hypothetical protein
MAQILLPESLGLSNITALAAFFAATQQDHQGIAIFAKIDAVARTEKEAQFADTSANRFAIAKITAFEPPETLENAPPGARVPQAVQLIGERLFTRRVAVNDYGFGGIGH